MKTQEEIEQLAEQYLQKNKHNFDTWKEIEHTKISYINAYTQCQEDVDEKKYTEIKTYKEIEQSAFLRYPILINDTNHLEDYNAYEREIWIADYLEKAYEVLRFQYTQCQEDMDEKKYTEEDVLKYAWFLVENIGQYACDKTANFEGKYLKQFKNNQD